MFNYKILLSHMQHVLVFRCVNGTSIDTGAKNLMMVIGVSDVLIILATAVLSNVRYVGFGTLR